jgi:hypothetical protein
LHPRGRPHMSQSPKLTPAKLGYRIVLADNFGFLLGSTLGAEMGSDARAETQPDGLLAGRRTNAAPQAVHVA